MPMTYLLSRLPEFSNLKPSDDWEFPHLYTNGRRRIFELEKSTARHVADLKSSQRMSQTPLVSRPVS